VDTGLDENEAELGILVLTVALKMLADRDGLLDQHVKVLWELRGEGILFQDTKDLVTSDNLHLRDTVRISEQDTYLRGSGTLTGELADLVDNLVGGGLEPAWGGPRVGDGGRRDSLSIRVKATHFWRLRERLCWGGES